MATLGYTTAGASAYNAGGLAIGGAYTATSSGVINNFHVAVSAIPASPECKFVICRTDDSLDPSGRAVVGQVEGNLSVSDDCTIELPGSIAISGGTEYFIACFPKNSGATIKYTSGEGAEASYYKSGLTYADQFTDPVPASWSPDSWRWSIWVDYTPSASGKALAGGISGASSTSSFLPYIYHYLIDNVVAGAASLNTLLPYLYHYLVNNAVSAVSSLSNFLPYLYHYLINNVVSGAATLYGNLTVILAQIIHALAGAVNAISSLPSLLPELWHYLVNNAVSAVSSISTPLPYIMHRLLSDTFAAVSSTVGNIELFGEGVIRVLAGAVNAVSSTFGSLQLFGIRLFTAAVDGVSEIIGNLTNLGGSAINKLKIYMKIHRGRF
jgi:hypothetical protein